MNILLNYGYYYMEDIQEIIETAVYHNNINALRVLLSKGFDISSFVHELLEYAIKRENREMVETLLLYSNTQNVVPVRLIEKAEKLLK